MLLNGEFDGHRLLAPGMVEMIRTRHMSAEPHFLGLRQHRGPDGGRS